MYALIFCELWHQVSEASPVRQKLFRLALEIARRRREDLDDDEILGPLNSLEWLGADKLVLQRIKAAFGGRLRYCLTGGSALSKEIQVFFADIGIPVLEGYGKFNFTQCFLRPRCFTYRNDKFRCVA